jgi:hypothetical protein
MKSCVTKATGPTSSRQSCTASSGQKHSAAPKAVAEEKRQSATRKAAVLLQKDRWRALVITVVDSRMSLAEQYPCRLTLRCNYLKLLTLQKGPQGQ